MIKFLYLLLKLLTLLNDEILSLLEKAHIYRNGFPENVLESFVLTLIELNFLRHDFSGVTVIPVMPQPIFAYNISLVDLHHHLFFVHLLTMYVLVTNVFDNLHFSGFNNIELLLVSLITLSFFLNKIIFVECLSLEDLQSGLADFKLRVSSKDIRHSHNQGI